MYMEITHLQTCFVSNFGKVMENGLWGNQDVLLHLRRVFSSAEDPSDDAGKTKADHLGRGRTWETTRLTTCDSCSIPYKLWIV